MSMPKFDFTEKKVVCTVKFSPVVSLVNHVEIIDEKFHEINFSSEEAQ